MSAVTHLRPSEGNVVLACRDSALARAVVDQLARYAVDASVCGEELTLDDAVADSATRVIVLELRLYDGLDEIALLRTLTDAPTIALIDSQRTVDPMEAIESGADDFLMRPCAPREVAAKVRAWLRRTSGGPIASTAERFGALVIDFGAREVRLRGQLIPLPPREFDLLAFLAQRPRGAFARAELLQRVWSASESWLGQATVTEHVRRLRRRVEDDPARPRWVRTVRGIGYRFEPAAGPDA
jgi:two-component system, OmpR family, phosphate regulon response regulator PhoB